MPRPGLRVLHIGNIGNNGYQNARILNLAGYSCDVLCHDYYHIMGCPEWEDAEFDRLPATYDEGNPDWSTFRLHDFERPAWFAQGPLSLCCRYLVARRTGRLLPTMVYRHLLALSGSIRSKPHMARQLDTLRLRVREFLGRYTGFGLAARLRSVWRSAGSALQVNLGLGIRRRLAQLLTPRAKASPNLHWDNTLPAQFQSAFPERQDPLSDVDVAMFLPTVHMLADLFDCYDVIIGYSTDPIYPMIAGHRPYIAYEHGTLRAIPFEDAPVGRLTALAYRLAARALITNSDCIRAAQRLALSNYRYVPHPMNDRNIALADGTSVRRQLAARHDADFIVVHPARLHWETARHPNWEKGNDIFLRGFARFVREVAPRALVVLVRWGKCIRETEDLLAAERISHRVEWIRPVPNRTLLRYMKAADAVADQFWLGTFGGITPKAMACARPVLLHLDTEVHRWCFEDMPPILPSRTSEEVFDGLSRLYRDPAFARQTGERARDWYLKYHAESVIRERLVATVREAAAEGGQSRTRKAGTDAGN